MSKSNKRDAWTYLIVALLMANLFVINNYITNKAIVIIEAKNNTSNHETFNIEVLKNGVKDKYASIISSTKNVLGMTTDKIIISDSNVTINTDSNISTNVVVISKAKAKTKKKAAYSQSDSNSTLKTKGAAL